MQSNPKEIFEALNKLPPFQRGQLVESYVGQSVEWEVSFAKIIDVSKNEKGLLLFDINQWLSPAIICRDFDLQKYPEFKLMREKENFSLRGKIKSIRDDNIFLENCEYYFTSAGNVPSASSTQMNSTVPGVNFSIHGSPGASIIHGSSVNGNTGGNPGKADSWTRKIIVEIIIGIAIICFAFFFNLNGNKSDANVDQLTDKAPTVLPSNP